MICVLKGAYEDRGERHGPGDFACNDEAVEHRPWVTRDAECVCLVAADHALVPRSLMARVFQPFVRI
jgi:putative transcriptional regulator